jgi:hypothetical protein
MRQQSVEKPRKGQRYKALRDIQIESIVLFGAPFSSASRGILPKGEIITIEKDPKEEATLAIAVPNHYKDLEEVFVPKRDRMDSKYSDYYLVMRFRTLAKEFERVP